MKLLVPGKWGSAPAECARPLRLAGTPCRLPVDPWKAAPDKPSDNTFFLEMLNHPSVVVIAIVPQLKRESRHGIFSYTRDGALDGRQYSVILTQAASRLQRELHAIRETTLIHPPHTQWRRSPLPRQNGNAARRSSARTYSKMSRPHQ